MEGGEGRRDGTPVEPLDATRGWDWVEAPER